MAAVPMKLVAYECLGLEGVPTERVEMLMHEVWTTQALKSLVPHHRD